MGRSASGFGDQDGAGLRVLHFVRVFGIGQKGEVSGAGVLHAGDAGDFDLGIACQRAPERGGDFT